MNPNNKESEINIKDLFLFLLKRIVSMFIAGAVLGCALGSYRVLQRMKTNDVLDASTKLNDSETDVQYELRVQNINKARVYAEMIDNINLQIDHQRDYIANSIYMQIDAENVYQSTAQITLTLQNNDTNGVDSALFGAYEREVKAGNYLDQYAKQIDKKPDYIKELISFSSSAASNTIISVDSSVNRVGSMYISVYGPSREFCDEVMDLVISKVQSVYDDLNTSVAPHTIALVGVQQIQKIDNGIRDGQISHTGTINSLQNQITTYNDQIDKVAKELGLSDKEAILEYFNEHPDVKVNGIPSDVSEVSVSRFNNLKPGIKYAASGFILGVFLVFVFFFLKYFIGKHFSTQAQFYCAYPNICNIGVLRPIGKRSKFVKFIDIKSEDDNKMSDENNKKLIFSNYVNLTRNFSKVLITGTGDVKIMNDVVKSLNLKGDFKPDIFSNPDVLASVPDYDAVVLLEQRNCSVRKTIDKEISLISNGGTPIVGAIII